MIKRVVLMTGLLVIGLAVPGVETAQASGTSSVISQELQRVRYGYASQVVIANQPFVSDTASNQTNSLDKEVARKSPGKAFLMSLILPGAGQWYYGSKIKAALFLGVEVTTIAMSLKYHSDGNRLTTDFQNFNAAHWHQGDYVYYLQQAYGDPNITSDTASVLSQYQEISHHLPPFGDGQYYEMSGKYNQFAWGWDDAVYESHYLHDSGFVPARITDSTSYPYSARRLIYEAMRHDANNKFSQATAMLMGTLANHVVSAFEAYITTKRHTQKPGGNASTEFSSHLHFDAKLKSVYARHDTPYLKVTYKF
jgi:hypothetical protein